ncbi:MFS transporter [Dongshaea marina]|uniref:MFS transporter n=1 Tax=Dongshaea marina TaxID=2047966 RepID=UPI000D3E9FB6|nr:MFS transporter [Dongshaea marina]
MSKKAWALSTRTLLLAILILSTAQIGISIYMPSLPVMAKDFSTTPSQTQWLITIYLIGFGAAQLFYGPWSDAVGRKRVFIRGQLIYLGGCLLCLICGEHFGLLLVGRLLEGIGASSASILARCVISDRYQRQHLAKMMAWFTLVASLVRILIPALGGVLSDTWGWRAVFLCVAVYLLLVIALVCWLLDERDAGLPQGFSLAELWPRYRKVLANYSMLLPAVYVWLLYLTTVVSMSVLPFFIEKKFGLSVATFGKLMMIPALGLCVGSILVGSLRRYFGDYGTLAAGALSLALAGAWLVWQPLTLVQLIGAYTLMVLAKGLILPIGESMLLGCGSERNCSGAVVAVSGALKMTLVAGLTGLIINHWVADPLQLGEFYLLATVLVGG